MKQVPFGKYKVRLIEGPRIMCFHAAGREAYLLASKYQIMEGEYDGEIMYLTHDRYNPIWERGQDASSIGELK